MVENLAAIMAERDEWLRSKSGAMLATREWIASQGWSYVSPRDAWTALTPVWSAQQIALADLAEYNANGPERKRAMERVASRKRQLSQKGA